MSSIVFRRLWTAAFSAMLAGPALAETPAEITARNLYAGTLEQGLNELAAVTSNPLENADVVAGLGTIQFVQAIEHFAQAMYRHGANPGGASYGPLLRMPLPVNPDPEPLTYDELRTIFADLVSALDTAEATLGQVGDRSIKLPLATGRIRIDIDGDGTAEENEQLIALAFGDNAPAEFKAQNESFVVGFDTADIYWLRGYANLLAGFGDFWLSFDFHEAFDLTFHVIFPNAKLPNAEALNTRSHLESWDADVIADTVALIHLVDWQVVEPGRLARIRERLLKVIALNRKTWASVRAETDDDREWLPSAKQKTGVMVGFALTDEQIDSWLAALTEAEEVLEGRKLMPHWRFQKGINARRVFTEAKNFDLVLWITGQSVLPFLEDGPVADGAAFSQADRIFGGDLLLYAFWFN